MTTTIPPRRWWLAPLLFSLGLLAALGTVWTVSATAREVLSKAVMMLVGALATPFILESSIAVIGLVIVVVINQRRLQKEGDGWVYLAQTEPDAEALAAGAQTPPRRLEGVILKERPETSTAALLAMAEGFLDLGLAREALDQLDRLPAEEQASPAARELRRSAEARLGN